MRLTRTNEQGRKIPDTYYTIDHKYMVEKGTMGWNVYRIDNNRYDYTFSTDTLKEVRESLIDRKAHNIW